MIRAFNNDAYEQARFNQTNEEFTGYTRKIFKLMLLTQPVFYFFMNLVTLGYFLCSQSYD